MSSDRIYLSKEEQIFLMEMLEVDNPHEAVEIFATLMVKERVDPGELEIFVKKIMKVDLEEYFKKLTKKGK